MKLFLHGALFLAELALDLVVWTHFENLEGVI